MVDRNSLPLLSDRKSKRKASASLRFETKKPRGLRWLFNAVTIIQRTLPRASAEVRLVGGHSMWQPRTQAGHHLSPLQRLTHEKNRGSVRWGVGESWLSKKAEFHLRVTNLPWWSVLIRDMLCQSYWQPWLSSSIGTFLTPLTLTLGWVLFRRAAKGCVKPAYYFLYRTFLSDFTWIAGD